nr:opioid growth factor receptor-like isoform X1 [Mirounga angustirostris]
MDDPDCDSTWEEDEEEDGEGPSAGGGGDGEAGAPGDADAEDEDDDEEDARAARPGALQVQPRRALGSQRPRAGLPGRREARLLGSRNWRAVRDTRRYRHHYPDLIEQAGNGDMPNLSFYRNEIRFLPNGCFIEDILQNWREDYDLLEENHSYIQWLFPLREPGVNWHAKPLTLQEIEAFKSSEEVRERFVQAYELMLGFYGIQLEDRDTGQVCRAHNYQKRFQNLNW